jgi:cytochrome c-type biogenesis protein CcmF
MDINILGGQTSLLVAAVFCIVGIFSSVIKFKQVQPINKTYGFITFFGLLGSAAFMENAFFTHDFNIQFVYQNNTTYTGLIYDISGMWSALQGSLLLWCLLLSIWLVVFLLWLVKYLDERTAAFANAILLLNLGYFCLLVLVKANPFIHIIGPKPTQGLGANPLLQNNPLVAIHPVFLYAGLTGFSVVYAISVGSVVCKTKSNIISYQRVFTIIPSAILGFGILLGALWSYQVLGWGGYWSWDPVENAALLPWILSIGALHSLKSLKNKNVLPTLSQMLIISTFTATLFTTFVTRSGIVESLHAFSESSIGVYLLGALVASFLVPTIFIYKSQHLKGNKFSFGLSKASLSLLNNLLVIAFSLTIVVGTLYSLVPDGSNSTTLVGPNYFNKIGFPIACITLLLIAISHLLNWKQTNFNKLIPRLITASLVALSVTLISRGFLTGSQKLLLVIWLSTFGIFIILTDLFYNVKARSSLQLTAIVKKLSTEGTFAHLGVFVLTVGVAFSLALSTRGSLKLYPKKPLLYHGHSFELVGFSTISRPVKTTYTAKVALDHVVYDPSITLFSNSTDGIGSPSIDWRLVGDIYLTLESVPSKSQPYVYIGVITEPAVDWIWIGGFLIFLGMLAPLWPFKTSKKTKEEIVTAEKSNELVGALLK